MHLKDEVEALVKRSPSLTEAEIAGELFGGDGYQQRVNSVCRELIAQGRIARRGRGGPADPFRYD